MGKIRIATDLPVIRTKDFVLSVENIKEAKKFVIENNICNDVEQKVGSKLIEE